MDTAAQETQQELRDLIRRVAREQVAPRANEIDRTAEYPDDMFALLKELGLFTLPFPVEHGGTGSLLSACIAVEEFGRVCYNTAYLLVVQWVPFGAILAAGTKAQQDRWLPGLAAGDVRAAFSTTEPQSGSDIAGIKTTAVPADGGWRINGSKVWCSNAPLADFIIVAAKVPGAGGTSEIAMFLVERGTKGLRIGGKEDKLGARGVPSCPLFFDDVLIPADARLGGEGRNGFKGVMESLNHSRPIIAARGVGLAQGALDHAAEYVKERVAFGQRISDFQGVRWMLADMAIQTEASRRLTYHAAALFDAGVRGTELASAASIAKCHATDAAMRVATDAVQLFGSAGISAEYPINRYFRDAKVLQIIEGTNQIQRNIVANGILGRAART